MKINKIYDEFEQSKWISVKERLPEYDEDVLLSAVDSLNKYPPHRFDVIIGWREAGPLTYRFKTDNDIVVVGYVTHWMPLPAPPVG